MIQIRQTHLTDKWADKRQISAKEANFFRNSNCQIFKLDSERVQLYKTMFGFQMKMVGYFGKRPGFGATNTM